MLKKLWELLKKYLIKEPVKPEPVADDTAFLQSVQWLGASYAGATREQLIKSARITKGNLVTAYSQYQWPVHTDNGTALDAICCLFYIREGKWVGGKFDWWRKGGQGTKTLGNVDRGYQGHSMPEAGTQVKTMIVSVDGRKRSNVCEVTWG